MPMKPGYRRVSGGALMNRPVKAAAAAVLAVPLIAGPAAAQANDGSLQGLTLVGGCPGESSAVKNVVATPRTPFLFFPVALRDASTQRWSAVLFPYSVLIAGEGLKARHLGPGEMYTRPGPVPKKMATCEFDGKTPDGPFHVTITGPLLEW